VVGVEFEVRGFVKKEIKHEAYMRQDVNNIMGLTMMGK
jgi:hypothetical protein